MFRRKLSSGLAALAATTAFSGAAFAQDVVLNPERTALEDAAIVIADADIAGVGNQVTNCAVTVPTTGASCDATGPNVTITPPGDWHGPVTITYTSNVPGSGTVTGLRIVPVSDGGTVAVTSPVNNCTSSLKDGSADYCTDEDTPITLQLDVQLVDVSTPDPAEAITTIRFTGVPSGATLASAGLTATNTGGGVWTLTGTITPGPRNVVFTPPLHQSTVSGTNTSYLLDIEVGTTDATPATQLFGATEMVSIEVQETADAPTVTPPTAGVLIGAEDGSVQLSGAGGLFATALVDGDGSEQISRIFSGIPANGTLSAGTDQGGGVWSVTGTQFNNGVFFSYTDPYVDTNFNVTLQSTSTENYSFAVHPDAPLPDSQAVAAQTVPVQVNAVANTPVLVLSSTTVQTNEDTSVVLPISYDPMDPMTTSALADRDGSETLAFRISNLGSATLNKGINMGAGVWMVAASDLPVSYIPVEHIDGDFDVDVEAVATESVGTCTSDTPQLECTSNAQCGAGICVKTQAISMKQTVRVEIEAVADTPTLSVPGSTFNVNEGAVIDLSALVAELVDDDGSEECGVTITWSATSFVEPEGVGPVTFNRGGSPTVTNEIWGFQCFDSGAGLQMNLPSNGHGTVQFCVTATTIEFANADMADNGPTCFTVNIASSNQVCGDGFDDVSEACDEGSSNAFAPNACRPNCTLPTCGDDIHDTDTEECDQGPSNSDTTPDTCRTDCRLPYCGDNVLDMFEGCDDGNNGIQTDYCLDGCLPASCGDGFVFAGTEECDTGLARSDTQPDACRTNCLNAGCGDGVLDTGEVCDDGNDDNTDGCPGSCQLAVCGDGFVFAGMEQCDQGSNNSDVQPDTCRTNCALPACGDLVVDSGEQCDDGNNVNEDPCINSCDLNVCGDGFVDLTTEECDDADQNSNTTPDACRNDCSNPSCGDGVKDAGEGCDLGAANDDNNPNGCKTNCSLPGCGDGVVGPGEMCDDGALNSDTVADACRTTCTAPRCGDGVIDSAEMCDDGVMNSNSIPNACRRTCMPASCGDGVIDAGETCDNGVNNSDTVPGACRTSCSTPSCGDGIVDPGEACDDGANNSDVASGACRTTCVVASCGDGVVDPGEACDDGAANGTDPAGCEADCTLPPACGDGFVDAGEECDDGALNSDTTPDACRTDCTNPLCGDGVVDAGEECDAGMTPSDTCDSECVVIEGGEDMGGDDMGGANNTTPDMGGENNAPNNGTPDMGDGEEDMGDDGPGTSPATEEGCCRTIRRAESDSGLAGWLALVALGFAVLRRRR